MDTESLITFFKKEIEKEVTISRMEHCLRVAALAERLALAHTYTNPRKAYLAGIVHDITKQKKKEFHINLFQKENFNYSDLPENAYHAFSGAIYLREQFEVKDEELLSAVRNHTLGGKNLSTLDKILYTADFLGSEYASKQSDYQHWIDQTEKNLYFGVSLKAKTVILDLINKKESIHTFTIFTYNEAIKLI